MIKPKTSRKTVSILALSCSPSRGFNSDTMLDAFLSGVADVRGVKAEKIYLSDVPMANYDFSNRLPDPKVEPELVALVEKLMKAKGLVIATPCFNFSVPAGLKNFFDRLGYKALDYKRLNWLSQPTGLLTHLHNFYLVTCGTPIWWVRLAWFMFPLSWLRLVFWYFGAHTVGGFYGAGLNSKNLAKDNPRLLRRCKKAGRNYARKILKIARSV